MSSIPHTHGEAGHYTRILTIPSEIPLKNRPAKSRHEILQLICESDGVIYQEVEITRETYDPTNK